MFRERIRDIIQTGKERIREILPDNIIPQIAESVSYVETEMKLRSLRYREALNRNGKLEQKISDTELESVLQREFQQERQTNPPLHSLFDPEIDLEQILKLPTQERRQALNEYKDKLARQRRAIAVCRTFIRRIFYSNPDISRSVLINWINRFGKFYGFTKKLIMSETKIVDKRYYERGKVKFTAERKPDQETLVQDALGNIPRGDYKVEAGPLSLDVNMEQTDTQRAHGGDRSGSSKILGFRTKARRGLRPYVTVNSTDIPDADGTRKHERQHVEDKLYDPIGYTFEEERENQKLWNAYEAEKDPESKKQLLEAYFRAHLPRALRRVKSEYFSRKKGKDRLDVFFNKRGGSYDFLYNLRKLEDSKTWWEASHKILVLEYEAIISRADRAFRKLEKTPNYNTDIAIAFFADEPMERWPKVVERQLGASSTQAFVAKERERKWEERRRYKRQRLDRSISVGA